MTKTMEKIPGMGPGMNTKALTAGYVMPWPKDRPADLLIPACKNKEYDPEWWHPDLKDEATFNRAARVCREECPLTSLCQTLATARGEYGVWGGVLHDKGKPVRGAA